MSQELQAISGSDKADVSSEELANRINALQPPANQQSNVIQSSQSNVKQAGITPSANYEQADEGDQLNQVHKQEQIPPVEMKSESQVTFETLKQKIGIPNPDALAKSYDNLVKKMTQQGQELSMLRGRETNQQQSMPKQLQQEEQDLNQWVAEGYEKGDLAARIVALTQAVNKPLIENQEEANFRQEIVRLSSSPNTAEFNLPEVQTEIQKIIQEKPYKYINHATGKIKTNELEDLFYIAKGRLNKSVNNAQPDRTSNIANNVAVEGRSTTVPPKSFNRVGASAAELEAYIKSIT